VILANSILSLGDSFRVVNDFDLLLLLGMMGEEFLAHRERYPALADEAKQWLEARIAYGPGTIEVDLDEILSCAEKRDQFKRLLERTEELLLLHGSVLGSTEIEQRWGCPGVQYFDYSTVSVLKALDSLRSLAHSCEG
jgi:hypothetical protein